MSSFNLGKKLTPAKKAWKSFADKLQSKYRNLKLSKTLRSSKNLCIRAYNYIFPVITRKFYSLINRSSPPRTQRNFYHSYYKYQQCNNSSSPIYVDQLFPEHMFKPASWQNSTTSKSAPQTKEFTASSSKLDQEKEKIIMRGFEEKNALRKGKGVIESSNSRKICDIDEWRTPSMPHINGVDIRAEEFISKFREDMELERQQSVVDFQEMLARGL